MSRRTRMRRIRRLGRTIGNNQYDNEWLYDGTVGEMERHVQNVVNHCVNSRHLVLFPPDVDERVIQHMLDKGLVARIEHEGVASNTFCLTKDGHSYRKLLEL